MELRKNYPSTENSLSFNLIALADEINKQLNGILKRRFGLRRQEWLVASQLRDKGPLTQAELVFITRTDKVSVSRAAYALANRRLIVRENNVGDGRSHFLRLTEDGHLFFDLVAQAMIEEEMKLVLRIDSYEQCILTDVLNRLTLERVDRASPSRRTPF